MTGYTVTCDQPGRISINMGDIQYDILDLASAGNLNRELKNAIATAWPGTIVSVDCFDHVERLCRVLSKLGYATPESKEEAAASSDRLVLTLIRAADDLCDRLSSSNKEPKVKMIEEPQKQWEQDLKDYGDNAYLMWEISVNNTSEFYGMFCNSYLNELFIHNKPGSFVYESLWKGTEVKRKKSAALQFDLERAKAGDAVEWLNNDCKWEFVPQNNLVYLHGQDHRLRMKYPPKISVTEEA